MSLKWIHGPLAEIADGGRNKLQMDLDVDNEISLERVNSDYYTYMTLNEVKALKNYLDIMIPIMERIKNGD